MSKLGGLVSSVKDAIIKPAINQTREVANESVESVLGTASNTGQNQKPQGQSSTPDPQKAQQDEIKKRNIMQFIQQYKYDSQRVAQQKAQDQQTQHQKEQKLAEDKKIKQFAETKRQQSMNQAVYKAQRKTEVKRGGA